MARDLKFFHFGYQCPNNAYLIALIKTIAWHESVKLHLIDITGDAETCRKYSIFSPSLVIVNDKHRWHGVFTRSQIVSMLDDEEEIAPQPLAIRQSDNTVRGELVPITPKSVLHTCAPCTGTDDKGLCWGKAEWIAEMLRETGLRHLGYLHIVDGRCVGGAEFLPSKKVPYPIPHIDQDAFLTCSYVSDDRNDYKSHPLERLIRDLRDCGFKTLSVAASEGVVFPNGPVDWFMRKGFQDEGVLMTEKLHSATIHLLRLGLQ